MKNIKNKYSFLDKITLLWWVLRTKIIDSHARLFRFPLNLRGRKYIDFGSQLTTGIGCRLEAFTGDDPDKAKLVFGHGVQINDYVHMVAMDRISIGNNVLMASHVFISDNSHGSYKGDSRDSNPTIPPTEREYVTAPVSIGNNAWIGEGVCIMPGVSIGEGCVIGAHSIVTKDIPDYCIAIGSPAKIVKKYNFENKHWEKV